MSIECSYNDDLVDDEDGERLVIARCRGLTKLCITVEPIIFFLGFAINFTDGVTTDIIERNICYQYYDLSEEKCHENLDQDIKPDIEDLTADFMIVNIIIQNLFPLILVMFVGSWSDNNGRKQFIIIPLIGYSIYYLSWIILSYSPGIPIWYYVLPSVPLGFSGKTTCLLVCTLSYLSDNFDENEVTFRFSIHGVCWIVGSLIGDSLSGYVISISDRGYQIIFVTSSIVNMIALIYTMFWLEETRVIPHGVDKSVLVDINHLKDTISVMLTRPEKGLTLTLLVFTIILSDIALNSGDEGILYLVGKTAFGWSLKMYNLNLVISSLVSAGSHIFLVWIMLSVFKWDNTTILSVSLSLFVITELMKALSQNHIMFWIATVLSMVGTCAGPAINTELYDVVSDEHYGKAFTLTSLSNALTQLLSGPLYTSIYKLFQPEHSLYVFFTSALLALIALFATIHIDYRKRLRTNPPYVIME